MSSISYVKSAMQSLWIGWEEVFDFLTRLRSESVRRYGICKLVVRRHSGSSITCHDGHHIVAGQWVGELHLDNRQVLRLARKLGAERAGLQVARQLRDAIKGINEDLIWDPELRKVQALTGITLLHRGIIHGIGFEQHQIRSLWQRKFFGIYLRLLLRMMHPEGSRRMKQSAGKLSPMMLVISKQGLQKRFDMKKVRFAEEAVS